MSSHRAVVRNGRLLLDEPTDLPEGQEVELEETLKLEETGPYSDELQLSASDGSGSVLKTGSVVRRSVPHQ